MQPPIIELSGVDKIFGTQPVLRNVGLSLGSGDRILLFGPNGAGKSTLLKILASLSSPTSGTVRFYGARDGLVRYRRQSAYLGHSTLLYPDLTGRENLEFFGALRGAPAELSRDWLARVGLDGSAAAKRVRFYSAGMKQRLAIARLFLHQPDVLLLDEPFNALDGPFVALFSGWIRDKTVVMVTHQLDLAWPLATRAFLLGRGCVQETEVGKSAPAASGLA